MVDYPICAFKRSSLSLGLLKLYNMGTSKLEKDLSVEKLVRSIRNQKILVKKTITDDDLAFQIQHSHKNVLDLDSDENEKMFVKSKTKKMNNFELALNVMREDSRKTMTPS